MLGAFPTFRTTPAQSTNNGSSATFCPLLVARSRLHSRSARVNEPNSALICRRETCAIFITSKMLGARPSFSAHPMIDSLISCFVMRLLLNRKPLSGGSLIYWVDFKIYSAISRCPDFPIFIRDHPRKSAVRFWFSYHGDDRAPDKPILA
jgi:hypothetical protein